MKVINDTQQRHVQNNTIGQSEARLSELQRQIHDALRAQHPEWIQPDGECPTCESYESRLAELLAVATASDCR